MSEATPEREPTVSINIARFPASAHRLAKVRAAETGRTLKSYFRDLIIEDVMRADAARREQPASEAAS